MHIRKLNMREREKAFHATFVEKHSAVNVMSNHIKKQNISARETFHVNIVITEQKSKDIYNYTFRENIKLRQRKKKYNLDVKFMSE